MREEKGEPVSLSLHEDPKTSEGQAVLEEIVLKPGWEASPISVGKAAGRAYNDAVLLEQNVSPLFPGVRLPQAPGEGPDGTTSVSYKQPGQISKESQVEEIEKAVRWLDQKFGR
jgi:hypothetical protein